MTLCTIGIRNDLEHSAFKKRGHHTLVLNNTCGIEVFVEYVAGKGRSECTVSTKRISGNEYWYVPCPLTIGISLFVCTRSKDKQGQVRVLLVERL